MYASPSGASRESPSSTPIWPFTAGVIALSTMNFARTGGAASVTERPRMIPSPRTTNPR